MSEMRRQMLHLAAVLTTAGELSYQQSRTVSPGLRAGRGNRTVAGALVLCQHLNCTQVAKRPHCANITVTLCDIIQW